MKKLIKSMARRLGYDIVRYSPDQLPGLAAVHDLSASQQKIVADVRPFTMTSLERLAALTEAITHITKKGIAGDIVECGVWRGGSTMAAALTLLELGDTSRSLYLFDTYEGMSAPTDADRSFDGVSAREQLDENKPGVEIRCVAGLEEVRANLLSTGYPEDKIHFIKGKVEDTLPHESPEPLALLRLDTDWYESTRHELTHLYPLLREKGVLIVDDYGWWQGARKAVDEYLAEHEIDAYLHRIDCTGRILIKSGG